MLDHSGATSIIPIGHSASATPLYIWVRPQRESASYSIKAPQCYHFPRFADIANPILLSWDKWVGVGRKARKGFTDEWVSAIGNWGWSFWGPSETLKCGTLEVFLWGTRKLKYLLIVGSSYEIECRVCFMEFPVKLAFQFQMLHLLPLSLNMT